MGIWCRIGKLAFKKVILTPKIDCGFLCCKLVKKVECRTGKTSFGILNFRKSASDSSGPRAPKSLVGQE